MTITMIFSGPAANRPAAKNAFVGDGLTVIDENNWGLPDHPSGEAPEYPTSFLTIEGDDIASAEKSAAGYGFHLRANFPSQDTLKVAVTPPHPYELARLEHAQRIAVLEARIAVLEGAK